MSQSLDEFIFEARCKVENFYIWWKQKHMIDPENYPLVMVDGQEGLWTEFLNEFEE